MKKFNYRFILPTVTLFLCLIISVSYCDKGGTTLPSSILAFRAHLDTIHGLHHHHHHHHHHHEFEEHISSDNPVAYVYMEARDMPYRLYQGFTEALKANIIYFLWPLVMLITLYTTRVKGLFR